MLRKSELNNFKTWEVENSNNNILKKNAPHRLQMWGRILFKNCDGLRL